MKKENHQINYSSQSIERYLKGEMSNAEMHAMEKAALDDPFLSAAIEGTREAFAVHGEQTVTKTLDNIKKRAADYGNKKAKVVPMFWKLLAAASVVFIAGFLIFRYSIPNRNKQLSVTPRTENATAAETPEFHDSLPLTESSNKDSATAFPPPAVHAETPQAAEIRLSDDTNKRREEDKASQAAQKKADELKMLKRKSATISTEIFDTVNPLSQKPSINIAEVKIVPGVQLENGRNLRKMVKMDSLSAKKHDEAQESMAAGLNIKRFEMTIPPDSLAGETGPAIGWLAFDEYITKNKKLHQLDTTASKIVELKFKVSNTGKPVNITISKSISPLFDQEAIRLLQEGPRWDIKGRDSTATAAIRF